MGWTSDLLTGIAIDLDAAGIGVYRPSGAYQPGEIAIVIRAIPQAPDQLITLATYAVDNGLRGMADHTTGVQMRIRGTDDPDVADGIADQIFDRYDSSGRLTLNGIPVVDMWRQSYTPLGQDGNRRWELSHNYYIEAMRPTANRTD